MSPSLQSRLSGLIHRVAYPMHRNTKTLHRLQVHPTIQVISIGLITDAVQIIMNIVGTVFQALTWATRILFVVSSVSLTTN